MYHLGLISLVKRETPCSQVDVELTSKQGMTVVLLQNATHTRDVLDSELEHD